MTTPEDRLRQILLAEAEDIVPAGDGLQVIQRRLADRRSLRSKLIPAIAVAGVVAIAGAAAVTVSLTDQDSLKQREQRAHDKQPSPMPSVCRAGLCEEPKPSPTLSTTGVTTSASGIPVWPVTTDAQAAEWERLSNTPRWQADPVQVTQHLMDDYLKLPGKALPRRDADEDAAIVEVTAGGRTVSQVRLVRVGRNPVGPWSVVSATSTGISVTQPNDGDEVVSPIAIAGRATDPDTSVHLRLLSNTLLGEGFAMAGRERPWTHSLPWAGSDWSVAALVANTFNGKGDLSAVTITAVRRTGASTPGVPAAGSSFLAVDKGHVVTVDALTGKQLRQLSYPEKGVVDSSPDRGGEDGVVWARTQPDGCTSSIIRVGLAHGPAGVTVDAKPIRRSLPSLSEGARSLAWVEQPCGDGPSTVVVRGPDAKFATTATTNDAVDDLDVRDDGTALLSAAGRLLLLRPGTQTVDAGLVLPVPAGCIGHAPAWDGPVAVAFADCGGAWELLRYTPTWTIASTIPVGIVAAPIVHTALADHEVLLVLDNHDIARLVGDELRFVPNASRLSQADW